MSILRMQSEYDWVFLIFEETEEYYRSKFWLNYGGDVFWCNKDGKLKKIDGKRKYTYVCPKEFLE